MPDTTQQRTEPATPKRRREAREKGQVAKSQEIANALIFMGTLLVFFFAGRFMLHNLFKLMKYILSQSGSLKITPKNSVNFISHLQLSLLPILMPMLLSLSALAVLANYLQVGFLITLQPLIPDFTRLNPINGIKNIFSLRKVMEILKSVLQIAIISIIAYITLRSEIQNTPALIRMTPGVFLFYLGDVSFTLIFRVTGALSVLAFFDYLYQRYEHEKSLLMTKEEVKEEQKQTEGDPRIKGRIRSIQLNLARKRMMAAVPQADVVITNPEHIAVALQYKQKEMSAPKVLAKGAGYLAERIKEIAKENNIPLVEDKPLARALYKIVEVGDFIPPQLYQAVAEILAFIYRFKKNKNRE
ncbi:MAG: flagellar biosynthesis protein FlhB [bacterium]